MIGVVGDRAERKGVIFVIVPSKICKGSKSKRRTATSNEENSHAPTRINVTIIESRASRKQRNGP